MIFQVEVDGLARLAETFHKRIVIYGGGRVGTKCIAFLNNEIAKPLAIADADSGKHGLAILTIPIISPQEAAAAYGDNALFLVTVDDYSCLSKEAFSNTVLCNQLTMAGCRNIGYLFSDRDDIDFPVTSAYDPVLFQGLAKGNAPAKLAPTMLEILKLFPETKSVVDVGCGAGGWLATFREAAGDNLHTVMGIDGDWVPREVLHIKPEEFHPCNFYDEMPVVSQRFDLAFCLEVIEHIPEPEAERLLDLLVQLSDRIIFSAAIPGQGGTHHVNEQWPPYWEEKFNSRNYLLLDIIRSKIWDYADTGVFYKQNMLVAINKNATLPENVTGKERPLSIVHPDLFKMVLDKYQRRRRKIL